MSEPRELDDWIATYMEYTENSEPPVLYRKWAAVSVIAAALQRKCWLSWGVEMTLYPNMYIVLVGPPAARKGTAMGPAESFVRQLGVPLAAAATTKEALIKSLAESERTFAGAYDNMQIHSSLTIFSKELAVFVGTANAGLLSFITDWFDCPVKWDYRTKNQGVDDIQNVWVNIIGAATPESIRVSLPIEAVGGGFTSRVIFVYEEKKGKLIPFPQATEREKALYPFLLRDLERIYNLSGPFKVTDAFLILWKEYYLASQDEEIIPVAYEKFFGGYIERRATHALKLSMILNASRTSSMTLEARDLAEALGLLKLTERKMPYTFSGLGQGKDSAVYAEMVRILGNRKQISKTELYTMFRSEATHSELVATMHSLTVTGVAALDKETQTFHWRGSK